MDRQSIERDQFRSSLLKQIIIRADFDNLTDLTGFITRIKSEDNLSQTFSGSRMLQLNKLDINPPLVDDKYIRINSMQVEVVHRFFNSMIQPVQEVTLDIGQNFMYLDIKCNRDYDCIDQYLDLMAFLMTCLQSHDKFVRFNRVAIRKIDGDDYTSLDDAYDIFLSRRFAHDDEFAHLNRLTSRYVGEEQFKTENDILTNLKRCVEVMNDEKFRFSLDIDTYMDSRVYDFNKILDAEEIEYVLYEKLNNTSFSIFREFVTDGFLTDGINNYKRMHGEI